MVFATIFGNVALRRMEITVDEGEVPAESLDTDTAPATQVSARPDAQRDRPVREGGNPRAFCY